MTTKQTKSDSTHSQHEGKKTAHGKAGGDYAVSAENAAIALKQGIVTSLSGINTIERDITALVRKTVSDTLGTGGAAADELVNVVQHVVKGAIEASEQVGTGLTLSARSVAKGIVLGVHDVNGDVVAASFEAMRSLIRIAATLGADVGTIARHAIDGMIEATTETGGNVAQLGKRAIEGAIEEAGKVSNMAVKTVTDVLIGIAGGMGHTIGAMLPRGAAHDQDTMKSQSHSAEKKPQHH